MALGTFVARGTISTNTDTAIIAAPGARERIYVLWITLTTSVAGTTSRLVVENGANGAVLLRFPTVTADAILNINYSTADKRFPGNALDVNTALNIETSGGAAATVNYEVGYEVKGG
jgi:hypothetical protein